MRGVFTDEQKRFRAAWNKRKRDANKAAGLCACGGTLTWGAQCDKCRSTWRASIERTCKTSGHGALTTKAIRQARKDAKAGAKRMAAPIIPVTLSACIVGGAVAVRR